MEVRLFWFETSWRINFMALSSCQFHCHEKVLKIPPTIYYFCTLMSVCQNVRVFKFYEVQINIEIVFLWIYHGENAKHWQQLRKNPSYSKHYRYNWKNSNTCDMSILISWEASFAESFFSCIFFIILFLFFSFFIYYVKWCKLVWPQTFWAKLSILKYCYSKCNLEVCYPTFNL